MKITTTNIFFKPQKIEYVDAWYFFLNFLLFMFFYSSFFCSLNASTDEYKHMHVRFSVHVMVLYFLLLFVIDYLLHLNIQFFKFFISRVQPQTSYFNRKIPILDMLYIFFLTFFIFIFLCSSFFFCLKVWSPDYQHMHVSFVHVVICYYF